MKKTISLALVLSVVAVGVGCKSSDEQAKSPSANETTMNAANTPSNNYPNTGGPNATPGASGMGGSGSMSTDRATTGQPTPMSPAPGSMVGGTGSGGNTAAGSAATQTQSAAKTTMSDAEIVAVTSAANNGEIEMAKVAQKSAKDAQVKSFAQMMITQHTEAETKGKKIAQNASIVPQENDTSGKLKADASAALTQLKSQTGSAFDKAYMDTQVKAHRDVLSVIDDKLMPNAKNAELKSHLTEVRGHVQTHLTKAEEISQKLTGNASTSTK